MISSDIELAHALMATLRFRYQAATLRRVLRGESPLALGRGNAPRASGTLLDVRTGRILVAAEAIGPDATARSVNDGCDRAATLVRYVEESRARREVDAEDDVEVWVCAPETARSALEREWPQLDVKWVGYDAAPARRAALLRVERHLEQAEQHAARRDAVSQSPAPNERLAFTGARFRYSKEALELTMRESAAIAEEYRALVAALRRER